MLPFKNMVKMLASNRDRFNKYLRNQTTIQPFLSARGFQPTNSDVWCHASKMRLNWSLLTKTKPSFWSTSWSHKNEICLSWTDCRYNPRSILVWSWAAAVSRNIIQSLPQRRSRCHRSDKSLLVLKHPKRDIQGSNSPSFLRTRQ